MSDKPLGIRIERTGRQLFTVPVIVEFPGPDGKSVRGTLRATFEAPTQEEMNDLLAPIRAANSAGNTAEIMEAANELSTSTFLGRVLRKLEGLNDEEGNPYDEEDQLELGRRHPWVSRAVQAAFWKAYNAGTHIRKN